MSNHADVSMGTPGHNMVNSSLMILDLNIYRSANLIVNQHGADAPIHAAMRADELLEAGDLDGVATWRRILRAVEELQRTVPKPGEAVH